MTLTVEDKNLVGLLGISRIAAICVLTPPARRTEISTSSENFHTSFVK